MKQLLRSGLALVVISGTLALAAPAHAAAILPGFDSNVLGPNDDGSTGLVPLGFTVDFFGTDYGSAYVNNNGNITFDAPLSTFTPFSLLSTSRVIIAPFFADVDTRAAGDLVSYGTGTVGTQAAFGVNWVNVDYFASSTAHTNRNSFQLVIVDRSDIGAGDFDFWFNYDLIQWETGGASGGNAAGCGGNSARVGWSNGSTASQELPGSAVNGAFLDSGTCVQSPGPFALINNSLNSDVDGRYIFSVRNGQVVSTPEPATLLLLGMSAAAAGLRRRSRKSRS